MQFDYRNDPILGSALAYWERKRGSRAMPSRADIDPAEIPRLLPNLQLIDVAEGGTRFRYRLIGTALVTAFGRNYTGQWLHELFPDGRGEFALNAYKLTHGACRPVFARSQYLTADGRPLFANRVYLPLSADGATVNLILGALTFQSGMAAFAGMWGHATMLTRWMELVEPASEAAA